MANDHIMLLEVRGSAINHSFITAHFLLRAYFLTAQLYKCMRLITQTYVLDS